MNFSKKKISLNKFEKYFLKGASITQKFMKENKDLIITRADKGNKTVILTEVMYKQKMEELLSDNSTYTLLNQKKIPLETTMKHKNNTLISYLFEKKYINNSQKSQLTMRHSIPSRIYGLIKTHKPTHPLRPVVSTILSSSSKLNKFLANILGNLLNQSKFNICNSTELKDIIVNMKIDKNEELFSLDVVSLFTNIPLDLAIESVMKRWNSIKKYTKIPKKDFEELLKFCIMDNNFFIYDDKYYKQTFGLAMGNNLSPILAHFVLEDLLLECTDKINYDIKLLRKYVDDLIILIPRDILMKLLKLMNDYHPRLKFTVENEDENRSINYLDMSLKIVNDKIRTKWYSKEVSSGRLLNFYSSHPFSMKKNVAYNFIQKVFKLSDVEYKKECEMKIIKILKQNNYPLKIIRKLINQHKFNTNQNIPTNNQQNVAQNTFYCSFPYVKGLTEKLKDDLKEVKNVKLGLRPVSKLSQFFTNTKSKRYVPRQGSCYVIPCGGNINNPCEKLYIGESLRDSKLDRKKEHVRNYKNAIDKPHNMNCSDACVSHAIKEKHIFDFEKMTILEYESDWKKRKHLESMYINSFQDKAVNFKIDTVGLNDMTRGVIQTFKNDKLLP